ncbi:MAG: hypothetical protein AAF211_03900, partial [Myxococcota bacterium]
QFGSTRSRYRWWSMIAMASAEPTGGLDPSEPVNLSGCGDMVGTGTGYQQLSIATDGLRYSSCEHPSYDAILENITRGILETPPNCTLPVPDWLSLEGLTLEIRPSEGAPIPLALVTDLQACSSTGWYLDNGQVTLCPDACASAVDTRGLLQLQSCAR